MADEALFLKSSIQITTEITSEITFLLLSTVLLLSICVTEPSGGELSNYSLHVLPAGAAAAGRPSG